MAARKKVINTAKSGDTAGAIRSTADTTRGRVSGTTFAQAPAQMPVGVTATATTSDKSAAKPAELVKAAAKPAELAKASAKPENAGIKPEKLATKPVGTATQALPRKAEAPHKAEVSAGKPEARAHVNPQGAQASQEAKAQPVRVDLKAGEASPGVMKATTGVSAPALTARAAKPAPAPKTNERGLSGGDQKTMKNSVNRHVFKLSEFVVYPAHGVGQIVAIEEQEVAGFKLELFVINFAKDKMTLRVPVGKVSGVGMRKLSDPDQARRSLEILTGRARVKRTMWSRRAQEYEAKINSGDINAIAEVVRDLFRSEAQPEQSYSERQLYEAALDRMMREIAAVQKTSETEALKVIDTQLKKNTRRGAKADPSDPAEGDEAGIEEAA
jgi:CarD family transcriptional regulator